MTMAASADFTASMAAGIPDGLFDHNSHPCAYLTSTEVFANSWVKPARGEMPLRDALKKT